MLQRASTFRTETLLQFFLGLSQIRIDLRQLGCLGLPVVPSLQDLPYESNTGMETNQQRIPGLRFMTDDIGELPLLGKQPPQGFHGNDHLPDEEDGFPPIGATVYYFGNIVEPLSQRPRLHRLPAVGDLL